MSNTTDKMKIVKLGDAFSIRKGRKAPSTSTEKISGSKRYLQIRDLHGTDELVYAVDPKGVEAKQTDVLIAWDGANAGTVATGLAGYAGSTIAVLAIDETGFNSDYVTYFLKSRLPEIRNNYTGATIPHVNGPHLRGLPLPKPPLPEQKRIAEILDLADEARRKRRENLKLYDDLIRSLFLKTFGGITADEQLTTVDEVALPEKGSIRTGPFGSQLLHSEFVDEGVAVLGIDNAVNNRFEWGSKRFITEEKYEQLKRYTVRPSDVLITIMGTCGRCAVVPDDIPQAINTKHLCCISADPKKCMPEFLKACFMHHPSSRSYLSRRAKGAIMDGLNMGIIKDLPLPIVTVGEQLKFSEHVEEINAQKAREQALYDQHDDLFNSLLQRAFKGEL